MWINAVRVPDADGFNTGESGVSCLCRDGFINPSSHHPMLDSTDATRKWSIDGCAVEGNDRSGVIVFQAATSPPGAIVVEASAYSLGRMRRS